MRPQRKKAAYGATFITRRLTQDPAAATLRTSIGGGAGIGETSVKGMKNFHPGNQPEPEMRPNLCMVKKRCKWNWHHERPNLALDTCQNEAHRRRFIYNIPASFQHPVH